MEPRRGDLDLCKVIVSVIILLFQLYFDFSLPCVLEVDFEKHMRGICLIMLELDVLLNQCLYSLAWYYILQLISYHCTNQAHQLAQLKKYSFYYIIVHFLHLHTIKLSVSVITFPMSLNIELINVMCPLGSSPFQMNFKKYCLFIIFFHFSLFVLYFILRCPKILFCF